MSLAYSIAGDSDFRSFPRSMAAKSDVGHEIPAQKGICGQLIVFADTAYSLFNSLFACEHFRTKSNSSSQQFQKTVQFVQLKDVSLFDIFDIVLFQTFGGFLLSLLWVYIKDVFLILVFSIPAFHLIKYFNRNIIFIISAVYFVWIMVTAATNFNFLTNLEPLEDGILKKTLEEKVLPEIGFSINDVYNSNGQ